MIVGGRFDVKVFGGRARIVGVALALALPVGLATGIAIAVRGGEDLGAAAEPTHPSAPPSCPT